MEDPKETAGAADNKGSVEPETQKILNDLREENVKKKNKINDLQKQIDEFKTFQEKYAELENKLKAEEDTKLKEKEVFKTAQEIDQRWVIELAADRTPFISQAQSINLFLPANVHKKFLHEIHFSAWEKGVKSLYYCRSTSLQRADKVAHKVTASKFNTVKAEEECLACQ